MSTRRVCISPSEPDSKSKSQAWNVIMERHHGTSSWNVIMERHVVVQGESLDNDREIQKTP